MYFVEVFFLGINKSLWGYRYIDSPGFVWIWFPPWRALGRFVPTSELFVENMHAQGWWRCWGVFYDTRIRRRVAWVTHNTRVMKQGCTHVVFLQQEQNSIRKHAAATNHCLPLYLFSSSSGRTRWSFPDRVPCLDKQKRRFFSSFFFSFFSRKRLPRRVVIFPDRVPLLDKQTCQFLFLTKTSSAIVHLCGENRRPRHSLRCRIERCILMIPTIQRFKASAPPEHPPTF